MEKEFNLKITKNELTALYESVLYYSEEAEISDEIEKYLETLINKIINIQKND